MVNNLSSEKRTAGIELHLNSSGLFDIVLIILVRKQLNVVVEKTFPVTQNWADLINNLPKNIACAVTFTGRGVFHKEVQHVHLFEGNKLVNAILPTVDASAYYWQLHEGAATAELCVVKKDAIDTLLERFELHNVNVQAISLGYFSLADYIDTFSLEGRSLSLLSADLTVSAGQLQVNRSTGIMSRLLDETIPVGQQEIQVIMLLAYCAALSVFLRGDKNTDGLVSVFIQRNVRERHFKTKCINLLAVMGFSLLLILSLNFAVFQYYYEKSTTVARDTQTSNRKNVDFSKVAKLAKNKEAFFQDRGWFKGYRLSLISAQIGASVPDSVTLTTLTIFPVKEETDGGVRHFHSSGDTVKIAGSSADSGPLRSWISKLKKIDYLKKIDIERFQINSLSGKTEFALLVLLK